MPIDSFKMHFKDISDQRQSAKVTSPLCLRFYLVPFAL